MKKFLGMAVIFALLAFMFVGCDDGGGGGGNKNPPVPPGPTTYPIQFRLNGDNAKWPDNSTDNKTVDIKEGDAITVPAGGDPVRTDYQFGGWFDTAQPTGGNKLEATTKASSTVKGPYFARWAEIAYNVGVELTLGSSYMTGKDKNQPTWDLTDADTKLADIPTGSKLRLTFTVPTGHANYGIGGIGYHDDAEGAIDNKFEFAIPGDIESTATSCTIDVWVSYVKASLALYEGQTKISIVTWNDALVTLTKVELITPSVSVADPAVPTAPPTPTQVPMENCEYVQDIVIQTGLFSRALGKGKIVGENFDAIINASDKAILRLYIQNINKENRKWGIGVIGGTLKLPVGNPARDNNNAGAAIQGEGTSDDFTSDVKVSDVKLSLAETDEFMSTNIWSQCAIAKIELWEPGEDFEDWDYSFIGTAELLSFELPQLKEGKKYTVTFTVDKMTDNLIGTSFNGQVMINPYGDFGEAGTWAGFNLSGTTSNTAVAVTPGTPNVYVYTFTSAKTYAEFSDSTGTHTPTKQFVQLIVQRSGSAITERAKINGTCTIKEDWVGKVMTVTPVPVTDLWNNLGGKFNASTGWVAWDASSQAIGYTFPDLSDGDYDQVSIYVEIKDVVPLTEAGAFKANSGCEISVHQLDASGNMADLPSEATQPEGSSLMYKWVGPNVYNSTYPSTFPTGETLIADYDLSEFTKGIAFQINPDGWGYSVKISKIVFAETKQP